MKTGEFEEAMVKRFNLIVSLLLELVGKDDALPISGKIERLSKLGLEPAEIAEVLGKKTNYVTAIISQKKKNKKKGSKK